MANRFNPQTRDASVTARLNPYGLPARGLIGLWLPEQYDAARRAIPNAVSGQKLSDNILRGTRRLMSKTDYFTSLNATVTDAAATGPTGATDAATLVAAGGSNWYWGPLGTGSLAVGTWTFALLVKRNTGSDQTFGITIDNSATVATTKTATSSWAWVYHTFTLGSTKALNQIKVCASTLSPSWPGASIQVADVRIYSGSAAPADEQLAGHLTLGTSTLDTSVTAGTGYLDYSGANAFGLIQFESATTFSSGFTSFCVGSKVSSGSSHYAYLSKAQTSGYLSFTSYFELSGIPTLNFGSSSSKGQFAGLFEANGKGYHVYGHRHDGTNNEIWINGARLIQNASAIGTPPTVADYFVGAVNSTALLCKHRMGPIALYNRPLTAAEMIQVQRALTTRMSRLNVAMASERIYVAEGDSISGGFSYSFPQKFGANASPWSFGGNYAITGSTLANLTSRASTVDAIIQPNRDGIKYVLSVLIGANDLAGYSSAANYITDLRTYCAARRAAGWKVVIGTILPIDGGTTHNSRRATVNTDITTNFVSGGYADAVADFAADATMGPDNSRSVNPTRWSDATHPSTTGHDLLEPILRAAVNSL